MSRTDINVDRVRQLASTFDEADIAALSSAIDYCGNGSGFKGLLIGTLEAGYDGYRMNRLQKLVRQLNETELLWLCENLPDTRQ